jgi:hypothetical protein
MGGWRWGAEKEEGKRMGMGVEGKHHQPHQPLPTANRAHPPSRTGFLPPQLGPWYWITCPPVIRSRKPSPGGSVLVFGSNQPLPCASPNRTLAPPQPWCTQPQTGPLYPTTSPPTIRSQKPSHEGSVSVLLLFLVNSPYFDFSTFIFYFIYTCIYKLLKSLNTQYLGPIQRCNQLILGLRLNYFLLSSQKFMGKNKNKM